MTQPPITRTTHTLPFDNLSPRDFERLCLWLVEREGYERAEHLGAAGSEQGRDIVAWREGAWWAFQCKRVQSFGPKDALAEVEKVLALPEAERPVGLVFLVTCDVSANTRQQMRERCAGEMECHFWASTELDEKVKRHTDIVKEFFADSQARAETTVSATVSHVTDSTVITAGRDVIIYEGIKPVSIGDLLDACQAQVKSVLYDVRRKYDTKLYVNRAIEREINHFFDTPLDGPVPNCFLLVAPAGSGKTNLLCELARVCVTQQPVLLLMGGNLYIGTTTGLLGAIQAELEAASSEVTFRSAGDSLHTLHRLAEELNRDALLILDAINEHDRPVEMRKALEDLLRKTRERRIKLVVTCRDYYWGLFKGRFWEGATVNDLPVEDEEDEDIEGTDGDFSRFAADEHERVLPLYLDHYQITGRPVGDAAEQCRHPLLLRFFCEAYRGQDVGEVEDIRLKELFDRYWDQKLASIAERRLGSTDERLLDGLAAEAGDYLLAVAGYMLRNNVHAIPLAKMSRATRRKERYDDPRSVYGRIRDEYIVLEEKGRGGGQRKILQVAFVYEEFMEYVMARSLIRDWDRKNLGERAILNRIKALTDKYESFAQILGVMVYLALMLKEERDLALWSLLLNKGESWQKVVFEAFRKLPEDHLDATVFDALEQMLAMGDESILAQVLDTLKVKRVGQAAPPSVVGVACKLATHEQEMVRRRAVLALGNMSSALSVSALIEAMSDQAKAVRKNAIKALFRQGEPAMIPLIVAAKNNRRVSRNVQWDVERELWNRRDEWPVEPLLNALGDDDPGVRRGAVWALGCLRNPVAVEPLIYALKDTDPNMRADVAEALGKLRDVRAVEPIIALLEDSDSHVRRQATWTLRELKDARAVEHLIITSNDTDASVRSGAVGALGELCKELKNTVLREQVTMLLVSALKDQDKNVKSSAARALVDVGQSTVDPILAALRDNDEYVRSSVAFALSYRLKDDERITLSLIDALRDSKSSVRQSAVRALGTRRDLRAVKPLIEALGNRPEERWWIINALGELGDTRAIDALTASLRDPSASVRSKAAEALGKLGDSQAVEPLVASLQDSDYDVRGNAAKALGELGDVRAVAPLIEAHKSDKSFVRSMVINALRKLKSKRAIDTLITALGDIHGGRGAAIWALSDLGEHSMKQLVTALGNDNPFVRSGAAKALRQIGTPEALAEVRKYDAQGKR
jgi:HEAT repeat protein